MRDAVEVDEAMFWRLLSHCRPSEPDPDADQLAENLVNRLTAGPTSDVVGFAEQLSRLLYQLDRREYGEELSGDAFLYTRAAVVAEGRAEYYAVLDDPVRFVPYAEEFIWAESLLYVPDKAYRALTGEEWTRETKYDYESYSNTEGWAKRESSAS